MMPTALDQTRQAPPPIELLKNELERAAAPRAIKEINAKADAFEQYMHDCGMYDVEEMRPINELRMRARWKLGRALREVERAQGQRTSLSGLTRLLSELDLTKPTALAAQRIGALPEPVLLRSFEEWREREPPELLHYADLIEIAKPYW